MKRASRVLGLDLTILVVLTLILFDVHPVVHLKTNAAQSSALCSADSNPGTDPNGDGGGGYTGG